MKELDYSLVVSSRLRILRNIRGYKFPLFLEKTEGRELFNRLQNIINKYVKESEIYRLWEYNLEYESYKEKNLINSGVKKNRDISGVIIGKNETFTAMINENDHLRLQMVENGYNIDEAYKNISELDDNIEENIEYAFDSELGFITSKLENLGTGMRAAVMIHIPTIVSKDLVFNLSKELNRLGISIKGIYGNTANAYGNLYQIANYISLGMSEKEIIKNLKEAIKIVVRKENNLRYELLNKSFKEVEDKVYRSYGILKYSRLLNQIEVLNLLSDIRLGVELGFLDIEKSKLNKITVLSRSALIRKELKRDLDFKELNYERARVVRELL
ncbi:ATP--guanido phosphotransferase [Clostridium chrysemydis]|uniref:ATP--guanido phosphotransferase n=1 Tax=Clostridium chrysemydis TaxID=2665504 RepID=UPI001883771A|nr:ATP--guanido phosphotransferase [Clostridium chrysemydis]